MSNINGIAAILPPAPGGVNTFLEIYGNRRANLMKQQQAAQKAQDDQRKQFDENFGEVQKMFGDKSLLPDDVRMRQGVDAMIYGATMEAANELANNPGMSRAQLYGKYFPKVAEIKKYKDNELQFQDTKKNLIEEMKSVSGFNAASAEKILNQAFYGNGDISKMVVDPDQLRSVLSGNLDQVVTDDTGVSKWVSNQGVDNKDKTVTRKGPGGGSTEKVSYRMPSFMQLGEDGLPYIPAEEIPAENLTEAMPTTTAQGAYGKYAGVAKQQGEQTKKQVETARAYVGRELSDEAGKIKMVEDGIFRNMMEDAGTATRLQAMAQAFKKGYEQQTGQKFDAGPLTEEILMKSLAYRKLEQYKKEAVRLTDNKTVIQVNAGGGGGSRRGAEETAAERKAREQNDAYWKAANSAISFEGIPPAMLQKKKRVRVEGMTEAVELSDITFMFPGGQFKTGQGVGARIYVDPANPGTVYVKNSSQDTRLIPYDASQANDFFTAMVNANKAGTGSAEEAAMTAEIQGMKAPESETEVVEPDTYIHPQKDEVSGFQEISNWFKRTWQKK